MKIYNILKNIISKQNDIISYQDEFLNKVYPVGSVYMSVNSTSPATLFGGTWVQIKDTFLLSAGDTYAAGTTGGEAAHVLGSTEVPKHNHSSYERFQWHSSTTNTLGVWNAGNLSAGMTDAGYAHVDTNNTATASSYFGGDSSGNTVAHNNMPPYLAVYMWKRTA